MKPYETTISKATSDFEIQKEAKERQGRSTKHDLISGMAIKWRHLHVGSPNQKLFRSVTIYKHEREHWTQETKHMPTTQPSNFNSRWWEKSLMLSGAWLVSCDWKLCGEGS